MLFLNLGDRKVSGRWNGVTEGRRSSSRVLWHIETKRNRRLASMGGTC